MECGGRVDDARCHRGVRIWVLVQGRFRRFARLRALMDTLEWPIGPELEAFVYPEGKLTEAKMVGDVSMGGTEMIFTDMKMPQGCDTYVHQYAERWLVLLHRMSTLTVHSTLASAWKQNPQKSRAYIFVKSASNGAHRCLCKTRADSQHSL